ncbi:T6SS phospholipase effector Tle1-like catalytic domain-containing protein [Terriglobus saanensis]|uniref:T6SS Phospholipase effector Tle1-like catalytic domain-containing protein n=1 Tax=Terriglobus saanensis (strain ATCC BAA-1853 / DSM 23119 / SP1PR4) TaxID=401053 RepID=E8UZF9_TERSS|nr:DUF2235 domain-containing protein [Terriglobus saanensis]ADV83239.1 Protein of unknown function DUF2235 [Terriglobus saanensis SP1PR4]
MADDSQSLQGKTPEQASTAEPETKNNLLLSPIAYKPKNIFVCCDGTGNEFAAKDSLDGNSNVVKLYTALKLDEHQVAYYHPGVGTLGDPTKEGIARKWSVVKGLAFGQGFQENVLDAYRYLMQHYASGDKVYLFGFSRGAYTARALAGLLHGYGLLCRGNEGHIPYAWRMYTERIVTERELNAHTVTTDTSFRDTFSHRDFSIHFVGLWDTVSSVGWISTPLRLLDMAQNPSIQRGRHAVSIDERRCFYQDNLWGGPVKVDLPSVPGNPAAEPMLKCQDLLQVWFAGVHSDVGGSYPQLQSGLANIALEWMIGEARKAQAVFEETRVRMVLGSPAPGEPTPETAALAPMYEKPKSYSPHRSLQGIWWLLEFFPHRYYDKDDATAKMRIPLGAYRKIPRNSLIHPSVRERFKHPCYQPKNITADELVDPSEVIGTYKNSDAYLTFQPKICRDRKLRQNRLVVFLVTVLELGLPLYAALWFAVLACRRVHPPQILTFVRNGWLAFEGSAMGQWISKLRPVAGFFWVMVVVTLVVLVQKLISFARRSG